MEDGTPAAALVAAVTEAAEAAVPVAPEGANDTTGSDAAKLLVGAGDGTAAAGGASASSTCGDWSSVPWSSQVNRRPSSNPISNSRTADWPNASVNSRHTRGCPSAVKTVAALSARFGCDGRRCLTNAVTAAISVG